jgi:hypothetical protein
MKMFDDEEDGGNSNTQISKIDEKTNDLSNKLNMLLKGENKGSTSMQRSYTVILPKLQTSGSILKQEEETKPKETDKPKRAAFLVDDDDESVIVPPKKETKPEHTADILKTKVEIIEKLKEEPKEVKEIKRKPIFFDEEETAVVEQIKPMQQQINKSDQFDNFEANRSRGNSLVKINSEAFTNLSKIEDIKELSHEDSNKDDLNTSKQERENRSTSLNNSKYSGIQNVNIY